MPRPTWDPTRPQDSDQVSSFPSLHRADKTTLKDIIGTLDPFGSTTTTWRQVQVGDDTWLVQNLYFDGTNWNRDDTTKASVAIGLRSNGTVTVHKVAAGSNPVGTSLPAPVATLDATSLFSALVAGTDPGGTESLRAGSARLNAPVLLGSVPQFTMDADPTAALQVATKQYADTKLARNTAETITVQHTFNPSTTGAPFLVGTNASGQLVTGLNADQVDGQHLADLDARFVNASGDSMSGTLVVGSDPGGSEVLRAQSLRAGSGRIGSWRILGVITVANNTTSVQFSSLSISPPAVLNLWYTIKNADNTNTVAYALRVNGETNSNDWATQRLIADGNSIVYSRPFDYSELAFIYSGGICAGHAVIGVHSNGAVRSMHTNCVTTSAADGPSVFIHALTKNTTISTLSSIEIVAGSTNAIGAGSVFMLEYIAP
jgi:hypothetical protein